MARFARKEFDEASDWFWLSDVPTVDADSIYAIGNTIYKVEAQRNSREANRLWDTEYFWTTHSANEWIRSQWRKVFNEAEEKSKDAAAALIEEYGEARASELRKGLMFRFGGLTSGQVTELQRYYDLALPNKDGVAFPVCIATCTQHLDLSCQATLDMSRPSACKSL